MQTITSSAIDLETMRSRIRELEGILSECGYGGVSDVIPSNSNELLRDCAVHLQSKVKQAISECSDLRFLGNEELDAYIEHLKEELDSTGAECAQISNEIEVLMRKNTEDSNRLESDLEVLKTSLDFISSQDLAKEKVDIGEDQANLTKAFGEQDFEIFRLGDQIEKCNEILNSQQDLESIFKWLDVIEQIEDALSGLKVVEFNGTIIRLALQTYVPNIEDLLHHQLGKNMNEPSEVNHELLIEVTSGTMKLKEVEMFPNDVPIGDIIDAAKSFRESFSPLALMETRSLLEWFARKVQERIIQCTLRRSIVKSANKLKHSIEYLDQDEIIVAHLVGGVDAFIKISPGWPMISSPLKLASLKSSDRHSNEISFSFHCKVEEAANSLDVHVRQDLSSFVDGVEKLLVQQTRIEMR